MSDFLSPDTSLALLKASQAESNKSQKTLKTAREAQNLEQIEATAQEFEAVFIAEMMKPMFAGISTDPPFGGGKGEEVFRSFLLQEYGKLISQTGSVGIADHVKEEIIRLQEFASQDTTADQHINKEGSITNETNTTE